MSEVSGLLIRLRELAIQSANGTLATGERAVLDQEAQGLIQEIDRIASVTSFNGVQLLDGSTGTVELQTGPNAGDTLSVSGVDVRASQIGAGGVLTDIDITSQAGATTALDILDGAIDDVSQARGSLGTMQARAESQIRSLEIARENYAAARSRIMDTDIAAESARLAKSQILQQVSVAMLAQANAQQGLALKLLDATFR
jgi:flagellin